MSSLQKIGFSIGFIILLVLVWWGTVALLSPSTKGDVQTTPLLMENGKQVITILAKDGYTPRTTTAKAGVETIVRVQTDNTFDCSNALVIPKLQVREFLPQTGVLDIPVASDQAQGTLIGTCGMGMYTFRIHFS